MDTISKNDLAIAQFRAEEKYHKIESEFSADFDNALENFTQANFKLCVSILIKCFRVAEGEIHKEDYKVCNPIRYISVGTTGGGSNWDESKSDYYLDILIDTLHDASIAMLRADSDYSPGRDIFAIRSSLRTTRCYEVKPDRGKYDADESVLNLLADLKDPLGKSLEAATTTTKAAFILSQICLRKIRLSYLNGFDSQNKRHNKVAAMIYVITFANDHQNWKNEYGLESIECARRLAYGSAASGRNNGPKWIQVCADALEKEIKG